MKDSLLPSRYKESAFRFYENTIADAVERHPEVCTYDPRKMGRSLATMSARLRDAMTSLSRYRWETTIVDMAKFDRIYPLSVAITPEGMVQVGSRKDLSSKSDYTPPILPIADSLDAVQIEIAVSSLDVLKALCLIANARGFNVPIKVKGIPSEWVDIVVGQYDIDMQPQEEGNYLLI